MRKLTFKLVLAACVSVASVLPACSTQKARHPIAESALQLSRVVLYRNGVGYFERRGSVDGDTLYLKVRKDHVNDLLKSLTVVERSGGKVLSVSMPLDPKTWANAALSTLTPGRGSLAQVLDALRGTWVKLKTNNITANGRILMVESLDSDVAAALRGEKDSKCSAAPVKDYRVTVLDSEKMQVVKLSEVTSVTLEDGDLSMAFHRSLDATAGEGLFQQVEIAVRLAGKSAKDVIVSYVVPAPMWKPTYRVVLPERGKKQALLQAWAVVNNTSGEDWRNIDLALTSGAPIAFKYDLHTPRDVSRTDMSGVDELKQARVAMGETSYDDGAAPEPKVASSDDESSDDEDDESGVSEGIALGSLGTSGLGAGSGAADNSSLLQQSMEANTRAVSISGLTQYDLTEKVTLPEGSSTMVAIINQPIQADETFMYQQEGAGSGYEMNPYRVVRLRNSTPFVLETGPISIYSAGAFVGEGIGEIVGAGATVSIPFAVEPGIVVSSGEQQSSEQMKLLRIVRGVLEVEHCAKKTTTWMVRSQLNRPSTTVWIRHPKAGANYRLEPRLKGTEDLANAYLIPLELTANQRSAQLVVVEQTAGKTEIGIDSSQALQILDTVLVTGQISTDIKAKLQPIVTNRQEIGRMDTQIASYKERRDELDQRASEIRKNLTAIKKDVAAGALRTKLNKRLEEFAIEADKLGRNIVELQSKRFEKKIELDDRLKDFELKM